MGHDQLLILRHPHAISPEMPSSSPTKVSMKATPSCDRICLHHLGLHNLGCTKCKGEGLTCTHTRRNRGHLNALRRLYLKGLTCHCSWRHLCHDSLARNLRPTRRDKGNDTCSASTSRFANARPRSAIFHSHSTTRHR